MKCRKCGDITLVRRTSNNLNNSGNGVILEKCGSCGAVNRYSVVEWTVIHSQIIKVEEIPI